MGKKITTIMLALLTGLVDPVSTMAEEKMQPQPTSAPEQTEAPTDLDGGISNGYPTPAPDETADGTVATPDASPDTVTDEIGENADGNTEENENQPNIEDFESLVKASFASGVEPLEDGSYVWNVNTDEKSHTFAYRLDMSELDQSQVKVMVPSTVFRDGEEGNFIASDLESESSKLHLKVYEIIKDEEGNETKLEIINKPRKEEQTDGVSAIAEANQELNGASAPNPESRDTSIDNPDIKDNEQSDEGEKTEVKYSTNYVSQLAEESGILEIKTDRNTVINNSVLQIEYTVEDGIYGNVTPQVFTAVLNMGDKNSSDFAECESNELEFVKNDGGKELKKDNVETVDKDDNATPVTTLTLIGDDGVESVSGGGNYSYGDHVYVTYKIRPGYHITYINGTDADGNGVNTYNQFNGQTGTIQDDWWIRNVNRTAYIHTELEKYNVTFDANGGTMTFSGTTGRNISPTFGMMAGSKRFDNSSPGAFLGFENHNFGDKLTISIKLQLHDNRNFCFLDNFEYGGFGFCRQALNWTGGRRILCFQVHVKGQYVNCYIYDDLKLNQTYWITGVYDGSASRFQLYIDGKLRSDAKIANNSGASAAIGGGIKQSPMAISVNSNPEAPNANTSEGEKANITAYKAGIWESALTQNQITDMVNNDYINSNALTSLDYTPKRTGYNFLGWYEDLNNANTKISPTTRVTKNVTLHAKWEPKQYSIWLYNQDGQDTQVDSAEYNSSLSSIFHFNRCPWSEPTGYKFAGWFTAPTGGTKYTGSEKVTGEMTLYAQYTPIDYTIGYTLNGGSISGQKTSYNIESADFTLPTPSKTGYTFTGWTGTGLSSPTKSVTVAKGSTGNRSYTANWSVNSYYLDLNGWLDGAISGNISDFGTADVYINGTLVANDVTDYCTKHPYGTKYEIKDIKAKAGHVYNGVHIGSLSGTVGANDNGVVLDFSTKKTTVNFYRNYNSSDATKSSEVYTYGKTGQAFSNRGYSRSGYTLLGWAHSQTATSAEYSVNCGVADSWVDGKYPSTNLYAVWKKDTYSISYNLNGGSVSGNPTSYQVDTADITLKNPYKTGYKFTGWTGSNGTTAQTTVKIAKGSTGNKSYTANWAANTYTYNIKYVSKSGVSLGTATVSGTYGSSKNVTAPAKTGYSTPVAQKVTFDSVSAKTITFTYTPVNYTITYDVNGGNSLSGERTTYTVESSAYTLPTPSRAGHTFTGWTGSNGTTAQTSVVLAKGATGNKSYKANWKANTYTVTYNANGGSGNMSKDTVTYGTSFTAKANGFTRPGYKFAGWTENADGTGSNWTNWIGKPWTWTYTRSITLYAQWTKDTYSISYNLNGGSISGNPTSYQVDTADITLKNPTKTGYTFTGWTGSNGNTPQTSVKIVKGSTGNKSYTANWSANTYTYNIKYVSKSGVALGATTVSGAYGSSKNVTAPAKTGYSTPVAQKVTFDSVNAKTITFTYTPVDYAITYDLVGGSISGQKTSYNIETTNFALPTPVRKGYTFAGWTGTGLSSATKSVTVAKGSTGARSYTATWAPTNYTITYNLDGGSVSGQKTSYNIETADFTLPTPSKTGHTFLGWTGTGLSSATKTVTVAKGSTGNRSYTANWSINQYDIILKGDGGTESVTYGGKTYPLDATHSVTIRAIYNTNTAVTYKVKPKYHIVSETGTSMSNTDFSWSNNIGKEGSTGGQTWTTCAFSRTITIKTASNQFTVAFNANTGTGTMNNQAVTNNANQKVNANAFKKTGYTFKNWNTNTDGTGATYANSATVDSIVASNGATVTLYAQWTKDTYSISYNLNGGSVSGNPTSYQVDTADITLKNPSKTGYSFAGWTGSNGTTAQTTVKIAKGSTGNKSYTANWTANTYTYNIKYVSKSGVSLGTATVSGTYGSSKNVTAPVKAGYSTPVAQKVTFDSVNAKTITFTYTPVDYTIIYDVNGGNSLSGERTTYNVESSAYTLPMPSRAGHTFTGWTGSNGTTAQTSVTLAKGTTGNKSYKANWKANTYTVAYNANGGSGNMPKDTVTYGTSFTAKANGFTRPGYKFAGWTENADGTGSNWTDWIGKPWTWTYTRSITLYAQWTPNKLTINYHNDGAQKWEQYPSEAVIDVADKDIVKTETVNYDSIYDHASTGLLNANRFTKIGYHTVEAWKVGSKTSTTKVSDRNGTIEGSTGQSVTKYLGQDLSKGDVTVDLYPVFVPNTYTNYIRHWAYGFENKEGNNNDKMAYHLKDTTFTKKYGEKVTYTTDDATSIPNGFSLRSNFGSSAYEESWKYYKMGTSFTQPAKATTAEYDYVPTTYTITYNLNGGTLSKENPSTYNVLYGVDFTNEPVRSGYKFLGWYINDKKVTGINVGCNATFSSADDLYAKLATRTTGNQTVEAKWEKLKDLTITNTVSGNMGSKDKDFTYTAQFPSSFANATLKVQKNDDGVTTITVDTNGKCTFTLKHGESFTFKELTEAQYNAIKNLSNYGISETDYSKEGYKTTFKLKTDANGNLQILFSNQNGTILPTGIEVWGTGAVIAIIGALMLVAYWLVHKH